MWCQNAFVTASSQAVWYAMHVCRDAAPGDLQHLTEENIEEIGALET